MSRTSVKNMPRRQQKAVFANLGSPGSSFERSDRDKILEREFGKKSKSLPSKSFELTKNEKSNLKKGLERRKEIGGIFKAGFLGLGLAASAGITAATAGVTGVVGILAFPASAVGFMALGSKVGNVFLTKTQKLKDKKDKLNQEISSLEKEKDSSKKIENKKKEIILIDKNLETEKQKFIAHVKKERQKLEERKKILRKRHKRFLERKAKL